VLRLIAENVTGTAIVLLAINVLLQEYLNGYEAEDVPFLLSVVVGILGLTAVDWFVDRKLRLGEITNSLGGLRLQAAELSAQLGSANGRLSELWLLADALKAGAGAGQLLHDRPEVPRERIRRARKILWSGVTLRSSLGQRLPDLMTAMLHRADLTILIADPSSRSLREELVYREGVRDDYVEGVFLSTLLNLQVLAERLPQGASFELGFHSVHPTYGLLIIDPDDEDGLSYVDLYHPEQQVSSSFVLHAAQDSHWFRIFVEQFREWTTRARTVCIRNPSDVEASLAAQIPRPRNDPSGSDKPGRQEGAANP
jgi:hypothetical protein